MTLTKRLVKGSELTYSEMDGNLDHLGISANHTFLQSGSATPETAQSRLRWQVYITDYLSDADRALVRAGTTVNIDSALSLAHTALPTNGGDIIFPPGAYKLTAAPSLTKRVKLVGAGTSATAVATGSTVIVKDAAMTSAVLTISVVGTSVEDMEFEGEGGNTGDGIQVSAGRVRLNNVAVYSMGQDGIRIGTDAGVNANLWFLQDIKAKSNGRHGVHISDGGGPDCNAGTFIHGDLQGNTSDGLRVGDARFNTFVNISPQTNGGDGVHITADAKNNVFFGGDFDESNTDFGLEIESGATDNAFFYPVLQSAGVSDSGTRTVLFYQQASLAQALAWSGLTSTATELNILDGVTATTEEINGLDISQRVRLVDDFLGDVLADQWNGRVGTDPQVVTPTILASQIRGVMRMTAGDDAAASMAVNGVQLESSLNWRAVQGSLAFEARVAISAITNVVVFIGFTDQVSALEMPIESAASGDTITTNATNAVGVMFDTAMATDNWWLVGVAADVDATPQDAGVAPSAGTMETWRVELSTGGVATFYRNGVAIGSAMTGAVTASTQLTPVLAMYTRAAATRSLDTDYIFVQNAR